MRGVSKSFRPRRRSEATKGESFPASHNRSEPTIVMSGEAATPESRSPQRAERHTEHHGKTCRGWRRSSGRLTATEPSRSSGSFPGRFRPRRKSTREHHPHVFQSFRKGSKRTMEKTSHVVGNIFKSLEEFLFPHSPLHDELTRRSRRASSVRVRGAVLLMGCETTEEHYEKIRHVLDTVQDLHSEEGLAAVGLEYRVVKCSEHKFIPEVSEQSKSSDHDLEVDYVGESSNVVLDSAGRNHTASSRLHSTEQSFSVGSNVSESGLPDIPPPCTGHNPLFCNSCSHRLFHIESETMVTEENRKQFIADGSMYDEVARLCQEYAQDCMCKEGGLEWVTIEDNCEGKHKEPIRALFNSNHPLIHCGERCEADDVLVDRPTLLIATGRGKVRAGIFSRQHLICGGIECSTAVPLVREALSRRLNVVIVDPNVHGECLGFCTFQKTMDYMSHYFAPVESETVSAGKLLKSRDLYILSHSASGGQLAHYLLDKKHVYIPNIKAIAFTDSTHNLQWARKVNNDDLCDMLESNRCIYFRYSNPERDGDDWHKNSAGVEVQTDCYWKERFGNIRTCWAGTNEHSLTNWYAHAKIWEHFDHFLTGIHAKSHQDVDIHQNGECCEDVETGTIAVNHNGSAREYCMEGPTDGIFVL